MHFEQMNISDNNIPAKVAGTPIVLHCPVGPKQLISAVAPSF